MSRPSFHVFAISVALASCQLACFSQSKQSRNLNNEGCEALVRHDYARAKELFWQAYEEAQKRNDSRRMLTVVGNLATLYAAEGDQPKALQLQRERSRLKANMQSHYLHAQAPAASIPSRYQPATADVSHFHYSSENSFPSLAAPARFESPFSSGSIFDSPSGFPEGGGFGHSSFSSSSSSALTSGFAEPPGPDQLVSGYSRRDGHYVEPYHRTVPDDDPYNNYSTVGNTNPFTGQPGYVNPNNNYAGRTPSVHEVFQSYNGKFGDGHYFGH